MATAQTTEQLVRRMLDLNSRKRIKEPDETLMIECIEACIECAQSCTACADDSLAETEVTPHQEHHALPGLRRHL